MSKPVSNHHPISRRQSNKMASEMKATRIDHCDMVEIVTNARYHYLTLKNQRKYVKQTVSELEEKMKDLEKQLEIAKSDVCQINKELKTQRITAVLLKKLCNHEEVHVLKGENEEVIDLVDSGSDEENLSGTNEFSRSDAIVAAVKNSTTITPVKQGTKRGLQSKRNELTFDDHDDLLNQKQPRKRNELTFDDHDDLLNRKQPRKQNELTFDDHDDLLNRKQLRHDDSDGEESDGEEFYDIRVGPNNNKSSSLKSGEW